MIKQVFYQDECLAIFIPSYYQGEKNYFFTPPNAALQVGFITRDKGEHIPAHKHLPIKLDYQGIKCEFIYVKSGCVTITIFAQDGTIVDKQTLRPGEALLQLAGGHGFYFEEPTQLLEVKQGPYTNQQQDKMMYEKIYDTSE